MDASRQMVPRSGSPRKRDKRRTRSVHPLNPILPEAKPPQRTAQAGPSQMRGLAHQAPSPNRMLSIPRPSAFKYRLFPIAFR